MIMTTCYIWAQDSVWTLHRCILHAKEHNLTVRQSELDARLAKMMYETSRYSHLPSLNISSNYGLSFGRSINPTTNQFENTRFSSIGLSASANTLLFGWFQKRYAIQKNEWTYQKAAGTTERLKDELVLTIATAYLRALLAKEQISNLLFQIELSAGNKIRIAKLLEAGQSNILELSQSRNQLAADSSLYYQALLNYEQALIDLKVVLNLAVNTPLTPEMYLSENDIVFMEKPDPEEIYRKAVGNFPRVNQVEIEMEISERNIRIAKAKSLPQLSMYFSTGTNYSSSFYEYLPSGERKLMNFGKQLNSNFSQSIGIGLSIPVFNSFVSRDAVRSAKINLEKTAVAVEMEKQQLKQEIYKACIDYEVTLKKYTSSLSAGRHSETAFYAAHTRYENGLISYFEYLAEKNNFLQTQNELTAVKYDLRFKKLVVEYYEGKGY